MSRYYPKWDGHSTEKLNKFRMNRNFEEGDPKRYTIGMRFPFQVLVSFGKRRNTPENHLRINSNEAIKLTINKVETKALLQSLEIPIVEPYAKFETFVDEVQKHFDVERFERVFNYPVLAKKMKGSRGSGMFLLNNINDLATFIQTINARASMNKQEFYSYFFEKAIPLRREFRLHVSPLLVNLPLTYKFEYCPPNGQGQFVRQATPRIITQRDGLIFAIEKSVPSDLNNIDPDQLTMTSTFTKPNNWQEIVESCTAAVEAVGLDFGAVDVLYDSDGKFYISEINSNPEFSTHPDNPCESLECQAYIQAMKHIILKKAEKVGGMFAIAGSARSLVLNI